MPHFGDICTPCLSPVVPSVHLMRLAAIWILDPRVLHWVSKLSPSLERENRESIICSIEAQLVHHVYTRYHLFSLGKHVPRETLKVAIASFLTWSMRSSSIPSCFTCTASCRRIWVSVRFISHVCTFEYSSGPVASSSLLQSPTGKS